MRYLTTSLLLCILLISVVTPTSAQHTITWAKIQGDGTTITENVPGEIVTYTFPEYGYFYIQESTRFAGIRVYSSSIPDPGDQITITGGTITTTADGEKAIDSATYTTQSSGHYPFAPLGMNNKTLGGGDFMYNPNPHQQVLQNTSAWLSVSLWNNMTPITGVAYNAATLTVTYQKTGGSVQSKTLTVDTWQEIGNGSYQVQFSAAELDTLGDFDYWVTYSGASDYHNTVSVVETVIDDTLGQMGVSGGTGLNNIGLLVRSWGQVVDIDTATPPTYYWLNDGSGVDVAVNLEVAPGQAIPTTLSIGDYVSGITGVSTLVNIAGTYTRVIYPAAPTVKITQDLDQLDPSSTTPVKFRATFSEPVTGFAVDDIVLGGTAAPTTVSITDLNDAHKVFILSVSGMTTGGTVTVDIPEYGAATSIAYGANSLKSKLVDNQVTWLAYKPIRIINKRVGVGAGRNPKNVLK